MGGRSGRAGRLMVSDDGRESEPMIAFMNRILMKLLSKHFPLDEGAPMCVSTCTFVHFASHILGVSCLIQMSYPYQTNEFHLVVVKWSCCLITRA